MNSNRYEIKLPKQHWYTVTVQGADKDGNLSVGWMRRQGGSPENVRALAMFVPAHKVEWEDDLDGNSQVISIDKVLEVTLEE